MRGKSTALGIESRNEFLDKTEKTSFAEVRNQPRARVGSAEALEEQRRHIQDRYRDVEFVHSFEDENGQVFDCIPVKQQPAIKGSSTPDALPPTPPSIDAQGLATPRNPPKPLHPDRKDRHGNVMYCPEGTVPVRRLKLQELTRFRTLDQFLGKHSNLTTAFGAGVDTHLYAQAFQRVKNLGGYSILSVSPVNVTATEGFSLSQVWFIAENPGGQQTVEAGWHVLSAQFGGSGPFPTLFTYYTADGYATGRPYDNITLYGSPRFAPGQALIPSGGAGAPMELAIGYRLSGNIWWLYVGGLDTANIVGYYDAALFNGGAMATGSSAIEFGGEVDSSTGVFPPMGSGQFANAGRNGAAYHRNVVYFPDTGGGPQHASLSVNPLDQHPTLYTAESGRDGEWGEFLFFGGPGGSLAQG